MDGLHAVDCISTVDAMSCELNFYPSVPFFLKLLHFADFSDILVGLGTSFVFWTLERGLESRSHVNTVLFRYFSWLK